jgi:hypothetical protein
MQGFTTLNQSKKAVVAALESVLQTQTAAVAAAVSFSPAPSSLAAVFSQDAPFYSNIFVVIYQF